MSFEIKYRQVESEINNMIGIATNTENIAALDDRLTYIIKDVHGLFSNLSDSDLKEYRSFMNADLTLALP